MKTLCILEYPEQWQALRPFLKGMDLGKIHFICASEETKRPLKREGIRFDCLCDELLSSEWDRINSWARQTSLAWFSEAPFKQVLEEVEGINLGDVYHWHLGYALVHQIKVQLTVDYILASTSFDKAIVFESYQRNGFQRMKDRRCFNYILEHRLRERKVSFRLIRCQLKEPRPPSLKEVLRFFLSVTWSCFPHRKFSQYRFFGAGALKDLLPLLKRLRNSGPTAFIDNSFQLLSYKLCKIEGIDYFITTQLVPLWTQLRLGLRLRNLQKRLRRLLPQLKTSRLLSYEDQLVVGIEDVVRQVLSREPLKRYQIAFACRRIFEEEGGDTLLLHEDRSHFRGAARMGEKLGKRVIVLSHGIPPANYDWRGIIQNTGIGETIVNSDFERDKYLQTGHSLAHLRVLGLPRYDSIYEKAVRAQKPNNSTPVVLYCPHRLVSLHRKKGYYLGIHTPGEVTRRNSMEVIRVSKKLGCRLWIKVHDDSDYRMWQEFVVEHGGKGVELVPYYRNTLELIEQCNLVITTFSTVVIEAMLFDREVITINFTACRDVHPYAERGIAWGVREPEQLLSAMRDLLFNEQAKEQLRQSRVAQFEYFGGRFDGRNTERVMEYLLRPSDVTLNLSEVAIPR